MAHLLLKLVAFVLRRIIWADDQVMRLEHVCALFLHSPQKSTRRASMELGDASYITVWRVLHKQLSFWPYTFKLLQELKPNDQPHHLYTNMLNHLEEENLFLD
jgi:hypothetical protein